LAHALINLQIFNNTFRLKHAIKEYTYRNLIGFSNFDAAIKHSKSVDKGETGKLTREELLHSLR